MINDLMKLQRLIEQTIKEEKEHEEAIYVGELPIELKEKFKQLNKEKDRFNEDLDLRKRQLALELERTLEQEFDERNEKLTEKHYEIWNEVYKALLVDSRGSYYHEKGKVFLYKEKQPQSPQIFDFTKPRR
jgi:hypothetical protein